MRSLFKYVNESVLKKKNPIFEVGEEGGGDGRCRKPSTKMREVGIESERESENKERRERVEEDI